MSSIGDSYILPLPQLVELQEQLIVHEGKHTVAYLDSEGVLTIGVGHNLKAFPLVNVTKVGDSIPEWMVMRLLDVDLQRATNDIFRAERDLFLDLSVDRQNVLIDMSFNLGIRRLADRVIGFNKMFAALRDKDYVKASWELLDSKWAKQVKKRALRLAYMMEHDVTFRVAHIKVG